MLESSTGPHELHVLWKVYGYEIINLLGCPGLVMSC